MKEKIPRANARSTYLIYFDVSELSISDLTANSLFFVLSGYETVANALGLTVLCLAVYPECQHKLINEITTCLETTNSARYKEVRYFDV